MAEQLSARLGQFAALAGFGRLHQLLRNEPVDRCGESPISDIELLRECMHGGETAVDEPDDGKHDRVQR
ncbi:MAG TPA: hypothetical protein VGE52_04315, partial [Pirellulales bacterium]